MEKDGIKVKEPILGSPRDGMSLPREDSEPKLERTISVRDQLRGSEKGKGRKDLDMDQGVDQHKSPKLRDSYKPGKSVEKPVYEERGVLQKTKIK